MTTLLHLSQAVTDMQEGLTREQRFSGDARRGLLSGVRLLRDAIDALERDIISHFDERDRSVSRLIGTSQPYTTVIDEKAPEVAGPGPIRVMDVDANGNPDPGGFGPVPPSTFPAYTGEVGDILPDAEPTARRRKAVA